jgi:hypothetical protein
MLYIGSMNCGLETDIEAEDLSHTFNTHSQFNILSNTFLKEIGFPLQTYHLRPFEWIPGFIVTLTSEGDKKPIAAEFDVVAHHRRVHPNQFNRKGINNELHFNVGCAADNVHDV